MPGTMADSIAMLFSCLNLHPSYERPRRQPHVLVLGAANRGLDLLDVQGTTDELEVLSERTSAHPALDAQGTCGHDDEVCVDVAKEFGDFRLRARGRRTSDGAGCVEQR